MRLVVYLPLVVPLLAAVGARPLAERLPPGAATWLLSLSALLLAAASSAVLGILALTAVVRVSLVDVLGKMSGQVVRERRPRLGAGRALCIAGAPGWPTARSCSGWPRSCASRHRLPGGSATSSPGWIRREADAWPARISRRSAVLSDRRWPRGHRRTRRHFTTIFLPLSVPPAAGGNADLGDSDRRAGHRDPAAGRWASGKVGVPRTAAPHHRDRSQPAGSSSRRRTGRLDRGPKDLISLCGARRNSPGSARWPAARPPSTSAFRPSRTSPAAHSPPRGALNCQGDP